jgi:hypothetical protein
MRIHRIVPWDGLNPDELRRNFHFPQVPLPCQFFRHLQVIVDSVSNIRQGFLFGGACDQQPGSPGQETLYPSSVSVKATG